ncbi:calcium homeostasis endoplasmic reticulum protein-like [Varanus komodoensis]|uniref:calcium homeostasis endoplasmic reticulum protein-like n=1 Tax=Varanus komodoensis TaxID=61221 RepID=UPI001CF76C19|nr:calcium homeostasis endoplasmic reticulum protein-like [Varanus komodoensis]
MGRAARPRLCLLGLLAVAAVALPAHGTVFFREQFLDGGGGLPGERVAFRAPKWRRRWVVSEHKPDYGRFSLTAGNFYGDPEMDKASHDRPRNSEGWEQNGLYEFFRAKMRARRRKGQEKKSSGPSPSRSRSKSRGRSSSRSNSRSSKSSGSYSRSCSRSRSRSYSRSRSRSRSCSRSSRSRSRSRSRSKSYSPGRHRRSRSRSQTPPSAAGLGSSSGPPPPDSRLGEENRGHQMLVKMGWSGSGGLGAKEQGIQDPIKGGDIRDKWDQYKGVGVALDDPYENYRRNKSYSFIARMKARDEN